MSLEDKPFYIHVIDNIKFTVQLSLDIPAFSLSLANFIIVVSLPVVVPILAVQQISYVLSLSELLNAFFVTFGGIVGFSKTLQTKQNTKTTSWEDAGYAFLKTFDILNMDFIIGEKLEFTKFANEVISENVQNNLIGYDKIYLNLLSNIFDSSINLLSLLLAISISFINFFAPTLITTFLITGFIHLVFSSTMATIYGASVSLLFGLIGAYGNLELHENSKNIYTKVYNTLPRFN